MRPESKLDSPVGPARTPTTSNHAPQHAGSTLVIGCLLGRINHELSRTRPRSHVSWPTGVLENHKVTLSSSHTNAVEGFA